MPVSVYDVDAVVGLDQLSVPVPTAWDVPGEDFTVQLNGFTQKHGDVLQVLVDLQWFH